MQLFIDSGSLEEIERIAKWGVISGVTTNPSLLAKESGNPQDILLEICQLVEGPVSAEVMGESFENMVEEGQALHGLHENIVVKIPFSEIGLAATKKLHTQGIPVNMTLVFSASQALLSAAAGATYISCFMGRLDDTSTDSHAVLSEIIDCLQGAESEAQILAASIRSPIHVTNAAQLGCQAATIPAKVLDLMLGHALTKQGIATFKSDWQTRPEFAKWLQELVSARKTRNL